MPNWTLDRNLLKVKEQEESNSVLARLVMLAYLAKNAHSVTFVETVPEGENSNVWHASAMVTQPRVTRTTWRLVVRAYITQSVPNAKAVLQAITAMPGQDGLTHARNVAALWNWLATVSAPLASLLGRIIMYVINAQQATRVITVNGKSTTNLSSYIC